MNLNQITDLLKNNKEVIKDRYYVQEIGIFGSYATGIETAKSDIDILVSFKSGHKDFFNFIRLKYYLEDLFDSEVDLVMKDAVKSRLRKRIFAEAQYV
jgi:predicted nucleotidyltransferase